MSLAGKIEDKEKNEGRRNEILCSESCRREVEGVGCFDFEGVGMRKKAHPLSLCASPPSLPSFYPLLY